MEVPRRRYEIIEPYFLPHIVYSKRVIEEKELIDRMDIEPVLLHLIYCVKWCSNYSRDYWIQEDKEILERFLKELLEVFRRRIPQYYEEFCTINPEVRKYELD